jgi:tRNA-splicing ligase RtcB
MELAGQYAYAGRDWVCDEIAKIIGAPILEAIHNHHNYAWKETHQGIPLIVVRKGATPAFPGQKGFIGASMGETAIIVEGVSHPDNFPSLFSTIHGAGRVMSRTAAKGKKGQPGLISQQDMNEWLAKSKVELRGAGLDEAPQAYKRLSQVIKHHEDSVNILHYLKPIAVIMAGPKEFDPFKD